MKVNLKSYILFLFVIHYSGISAQKIFAIDSIGNNSVFAELGGRTQYYCVGYQRTCIKGKNFRLDASLGLSKVPENGLSIPFSLQTSFGKKKDCLILYACAVNNFARFPSQKYFKEKKEAIAINKACSPLFIKSYNTQFSYGAGYCRFLTQRLCMELDFVLWTDYYEDYDIIEETCKKFKDVHPWAGIKINYYL